MISTTTTTHTHTSVGCGVPDTREHLLLDCTRWAFHRERLQDWLQTTGASDLEEGGVPPNWGWDFLVGTSRGRLWLGRFLVVVRPRWTMRDQLQSEPEDSDDVGV